MFRLINTIVLALFLVPQVNNTILWINYELNKKAITEEFCVNKEKPKLDCQGKCHLAEQLTESNPAPESNEPVEVNFVPQLPLFFEESQEFSFGTEQLSLKIDHSFHFYSFSPVFKIEHPPKA